MKTKGVNFRVEKIPVNGQRGKERWLKL